MSGGRPNEGRVRIVAHVLPLTADDAIQIKTNRKTTLGMTERRLLRWLIHMMNDENTYRYFYTQRFIRN